MLSLKQKLLHNELTIGTWITIGHPSIIEILSTAGFDWMTLDMEHSAINTETAQDLISHIENNGMVPLVRVSKNEEVVIKKVMDAGAAGVIVPMVKNRDEAEQAVSYVKYPPYGRRGVGLSRAQKYGIGFKEYAKWVQEESVVIAQIEHIDAVENLESILKTEGIDGTIIGPYDLSASMGYPGDYDRKEVKEALDKVERVTRSLNKPLGVHVIKPQFKELKEKIDKGYKFVAFSLDFFFLGEKAREEMAKVK